MGAKLLDVAFRVDAGAAMGGGHLARCSALASVMRDHGWRTTLYGSTETIALAAGEEDFADAIRLAPAACGDPDAVGSHHDLIVIDHYGLDVTFESAAREKIGAALVLSDHANRLHVCDVLVDQNLGREAADYADFLDPGCAVLAGSNYVLLRPVYRHFKRIEPPQVRMQAQNLLVTFGASDPNNATGVVLEQLRMQASPKWKIRVILGPSYGHADAVAQMARDWPALEMVRAPDDLLSSMRWADAAISAAGGTCWELCYMAIPFAVATLGTSSNTNARRLQDEGAAIDLGGTGSIGEGLAGALKILMGEAARRQSMANHGFSLIDGRGAARVCDEIEKEICAS